VDTNQNGTIDVGEFSAAFRVVHALPDAWRVVVDRLVEIFYRHRTHLKALFRLMDTDASGSLDFPEFRAGMQGLNVLVEEPLSEGELRTVFTAFDKNGDQLVSYEEFVNFLHDLKVTIQE